MEQIKVNGNEIWFLLIPLILPKCLCLCVWERMRCSFCFSVGSLSVSKCRIETKSKLHNEWGTCIWCHSDGFDSNFFRSDATVRVSSFLPFCLGYLHSAHIEMSVSIQPCAFNPIFIRRTIFSQLNEFFIYYSPFSLYLSLSFFLNFTVFGCHFLCPHVVVVDIHFSFRLHFRIGARKFHLWFFTWRMIRYNILFPSECQHFPMLLKRATLLLFGDIRTHAHCRSGKYTKWTISRLCLLCIK